MIFYLAILGAIFRGIYNFSFKLVGEKGYNPSKLMLYNSVFFTLYAFIAICFVGGDIFDARMFVILVSAHAISYFFARYFNYLSQKDVPAYIYYAIQRLRTIILVFVGYFFFNELITTKQIVGIILAVGASFLLLQRDKYSKNFKKFNVGIFLSIVSLAFYTICVPLYKSGLAQSSIFMFLFINHLISILLAGFTNRLEGNYLGENEELGAKDYLIMSSFFTLLVFIADAIYATGLNNLNMSVMSAISVIATFVPIILAFILLGEKMTYKKIGALIIIVVAIYFLK